MQSYMKLLCWISMMINVNVFKNDVLSLNIDFQHGTTNLLLTYTLTHLKFVLKATNSNKELHMKFLLELFIIPHERYSCNLLEILFS